MLLLIAIIALSVLLIVGVLDLYSRYFGPAAGGRNSSDLQLRSSSRSSTTPANRLPGFQPRGVVDTSGYAPLVSSLDRLGSQRLVANDRRELEAARSQGDRKDRSATASRRNAGDPAAILNYLMFRPCCLDSEGEPKHAYETLEEARSLLRRMRPWRGNGSTPSFIFKA